ncbi:MAG: lipoprotein signal peptidase [Muribaculaceae bacterium]|nr:lipoprotein signal peptidase [Muribaculaceae bacterium]MBR6490054.1 lipoprotein signal peptidase [Muribaculaceae bacterium]
MKKISNGWLATIIIAIVIIIDQVSKIYVKTHFYIGEQIDVTSWFKILFIENNGMAFGMELGSKTILTWLRIIFSALFIYYLFKIRRRTDLPRGFVVCVSLITAGAIGNVIDCIAYGQIFNDPHYPQIAQFLPSEGGYAPLFNGKVVDMLYFPLAEWDWPQWMPGVGGDHFLFFQPVFNVADACLTTSIIAVILFYNKLLTSDKKKDDEKGDEATEKQNETTDNDKEESQND